MVDWKKDVKLSDLVGRKSAEEAEARDSAGAATPAEPKTPFWKKEISLGGKAKEPKAPKTAKQPKAAKAKREAANADASTPFWKKEISFGRSKGPTDAEPAQEAEAAVVEAAPLVAVPAVEQAVAASAEVEPTGTVPVETGPEAVTELPGTVPAHAAPVPTGDAEPTAADASDYGWLTAAIETADAEVRSWADLAVDGEGESEPELPAPTPLPVEPVAPPVEPPPAAEVVVPEEVAPQSAAVAAVTPTVVNPPVAAADLPPLEDEKKQPFWKKELSFGRKAKTADAAASAAPKREKPKKEAKSKKDAQPKAKGAAKAKGEPKAKQPKPKAGASRATLRRHKKLVGLKVGASQLAAAEVVNNGSAQLVSVARESLDAGVVVGGELREPDALADALREFFKKHKLPRKNVRLGIANNRIGVRTFDLVGIDEPKQLANAIRFRAQEALPIPIDEAVLDYQILAEGVGEDGQKTRRILLVVAYRELIDRYVTACRKAGITLVGIDLEAFALLRALGEPEVEGPAEAAFVAVAIGHDRSTFGVSAGRTCEFTRVLDWGGQTLNIAIARALHIAPSEAEEIKLGLSLTTDEVPAGVSGDDAAKAREAVRAQVQSFARELVSSLQFYQNQPGSLGIGEIVIAGGTAHLDGLAEELQRLIGVPVRVGDALARVKVGKRVETDEPSGSLAVAIGLGIEEH